MTQSRNTKYKLNYEYFPNNSVLSFLSHMTNRTFPLATLSQDIFMQVLSFDALGFTRCDLTLVYIQFSWYCRLILGKELSALRFLSIACLVAYFFSFCLSSVFKNFFLNR